jgi:hypothetical protein
MNLNMRMLENIFRVAASGHSDEVLSFPEGQNCRHGMLGLSLEVKYPIIMSRKNNHACMHVQELTPGSFDANLNSELFLYLCHLFLKLDEPGLN